MHFSDYHKKRKWILFHDCEGKPQLSFSHCEILSSTCSALKTMSKDICLCKLLLEVPLTLARLCMRHTLTKGALFSQSKLCFIRTIPEILPFPPSHPPPQLYRESWTNLLICTAGRRAGVDMFNRQSSFLGSQIFSDSNALMSPSKTNKLMLSAFSCSSAVSQNAACFLQGDTCELSRRTPDMQDNY